MAHPPENPTPTFTEEGKWVASCILEFAPDLTPIFDVPMRGLSGNEKGSLEGALSYKENFLICREKKMKKECLDKTEKKSTKCLVKLHLSLQFPPPPRSYKLEFFIDRI